MKNVVLILSILFCKLLFAGSASELVNQIEGRTLVVALETTIKSKYDKLNEEGKASYSKAVENYNRKIKEVAEGFWKLNSRVEFKTWDGINGLIKSGADSYVLLYAGNYSVQPSAIEMMQKGLRFYPDIFADNEKREYVDFYTSFKLCFAEDFRSDKYILARSVSNIWPLKEDLIFAFQYIQCILNEAKATNMTTNAKNVAGFNKHTISSSTLLLKKALLKDELNNEVINRYYPYKYIVVNSDSLLKDLMGRQNVSYVEIVPVMIGTGEAVRLGYEHVLMNAASGKIVGYIPVNYSALHATMGHGTMQKYISTGALEKYGSASKPSSTGEPE